MAKPKIRFKGYEDDWEQRKLGELGTVQTCKRIFKEQTSKQGEIPFFKNGTIGLKPDSYISREVYEEFRRLYPYPEVGDTLISVVGSIGRTAEYTGKDEYFQDSNVVWLKTDGNINKKFLKVSYQVIKWLIEGSTVKHLYNDNILRSDIVMPSSQREQVKIAEFFESFDRLITLHQQKCNETKKLKKYMLQKMFPETGEKTPKIRFKGFTDDWEQREFSNIAVRESSVCTSSSDFPSVEYEDVVAEEGRLNKDICSKEIIKSGIIFDGSQVLYGKLRPYLHNWLNPEFKGIAVGDWWVLKPVNTDKNFLYRLIQTQQFDNIANQSSGSKMPRADWKLISNSYFMIPFLKEEQRKIGEYFNDLDNLITLHQQKCEELQKIKKFMLQNMFI